MAGVLALKGSSSPFSFLFFFLEDLGRDELLCCAKVPPVLAGWLAGDFGMRGS
jgi:hypothetical protein